MTEGPTRLNILAAVSNDWLDRHSSSRPSVLQALQISTGYSQALVERALHAVFAELTKDKMEAYVASLPPHVPSARPLKVLHIAAGNVFTAWLHGVVISLLLGYRVWVKPSSHEPVFAALWKKSVASVSPSLAESIDIVSEQGLFTRPADAVIVYGSDETIHQLREKFAPMPFVGYGHKISVAIVFREAAQAVFERASQDVEAFDLEGCLSPQIFYVQDDATALAQAIRTRLPNSVMPQWKSFCSLDQVWGELNGSRDYLSCIGVAGSAIERQWVADHFKAIPSVRVCELGDMQRPPLNWRNGGINLGEFLLKCGSS